MSIYRLLILVALNVALVIVAAYVVKHSIREALNALKVALRSEITTVTGRLNFISMVLIVLAMFVFNLHEMVANALSVDGKPLAGDHVIAPAALIGLFFVCSLICVMIVEIKK